MKIQHVITRMIVGGAQENTLNSVIGLASRPNREVALMTGRQTGAEGDLLDGLRERIDVRYIDHLQRSIRPISDVLALQEITKALRSDPPDVFHTHSSKAGVLGRLAARRAGVPVVVHTLHSLVYHEYQHALVRSTYQQIKRSMVPFTTFYVSVSDNIRLKAIHDGIGRADQHCTIRSGFDTQTFSQQIIERKAARMELSLPLDATIIGVVARLAPLKGHEEILTASRQLFAQAPNAVLAFAGDGPLKDRLISISKDLEIEDRVRFLGRIAPSQIAVAFSAFDILAHASLREGLARILPQGIIAGLPIVTYDLDGANEVITDGVNGYLIHPRDHHEFAMRLADLANDEILRISLGGVGRDQMIEDFSTRRMVEQLDHLYDRLVSARIN